MTLHVTKRDGTKEAFSLKKIHRVVMAAGLTEEQAQTLLTNLKSWAESKGDAVVTSLEIRDEVLLEMQKLNEYAANMFAWYQKTKDKKH